LRIREVNGHVTAGQTVAKWTVATDTSAELDFKKIKLRRPKAAKLSKLVRTRLN